jgi:nucleoid-associated protein YgaU
MRRTNTLGIPRRFGELERYGLLALLAAFLLTLAYLHEELRRGRGPRQAARYYDEIAQHARPGDDSLRASLSGGGEAPPAVPAVAQEPGPRPPFDFYEPPVRLPGHPAPAPEALAAGTVAVRKGDTLGAIAERVLGSAEEWPRLVKANPGVDPKRLKPGQVLVVPGAVPRNPPSVAGSAGSTRRYEVGRNDTLEKISLRFYGTRTRWIDILEANRAAIGSPERLQVGTTLQIP